MHSRYTWGARGFLLVTLIVVAPVLALWVLLQDADSAVEDVQMSAFITYALVLGAAVFTYFHWRMSVIGPGTGRESRLAGWLTVGLTVGAVQGLVAAADPDRVGAGTDRWPMVNQLVALLLLCGIALVAERIDVPADPGLVGGVLGLLLAGGDIATMTMRSPLILSETVVAVLNAVVLLTGLTLTLIVLNRTRVSLWVRRRLAFSIIALSGAQCAANLAGDHPRLMAPILVANLVGSIVLGTMAQALLHRSVFVYHEELRRLHESLAQTRADVLGDRELLHEVGSTIAGITSASRMIRQDRPLPAGRRERLEAMVVAEIARLERLMSDRAPSGVTDIDVDEVVAPIVLSHQARGRDVQWTPTHHWAYADADDLAEVVNVLLENASRHGSGPTRLDVGVDDDYVRVTCSDSGPGVPPELRDHLFRSGVHRPGSEGQGLGLAIAHRLVTSAGGSLELVPTDLPGATFVALVPRSEPAHATANIA